MKKRSLILLFILLALLSVLINQNFIKFVYVSPNTNISVLPYLTKSVKPIENNFKRIMTSCQKEHKDMRYTYINYYGSGFLKENSIPNDLDISVGIDLGTYNFDGKNAEEIAKDLERKISAFHIYMTTAFIIDKNINYVVNTPEIAEFTELQNKKTNTIKNIKNGLNQVLAGKVQVLHFNKKYQEKNVDYTFILGKNEILANDYTPIFAYTKGLKYNNKMSDYPREITILPDFYVTIKNTKTQEIKHIELIEESFLGERFQLSRRFFVPIIFTGNNSLKYIKKLDFLNNDQKYIETRMFNYFRYLNEIELYFELAVDNVKLMKRMHQCADIIEPALSTENKDKIYKDISDVLANNDIKTANEYSNAIKNLTAITGNSYMFQKALGIGYIENLIEVSTATLNELSKNHNYKDETDKLKIYHLTYTSMATGITNKQKLAELNNYLDDNSVNISINVTKIVNSNIENRMKFLKDYEILKEISTKAGFHKIEVHQYDLENIYITKNDFTKNLCTKDLQKLAKENNMPEANYKLIDENKIQSGSRSEIKYVRFNSTDAENKYWQELQNKLLADKKNFKIKRKYVF